MAENFEAITTQEQFDKAVQDRIKRERETLEKKYADYDATKTSNTALETENIALKASIEESSKNTDKYNKDISDFNARIAGYETANMRTRIALQHGIPYELASRLIGDDEVSITADAKKLAELVGQTEPTAPLKDTERNTGNDGAYKSLLENLNLGGE